MATISELVKNPDFVTEFKALSVGERQKFIDAVEMTDAEHRALRQLSVDQAAAEKKGGGFFAGMAESILRPPATMLARPAQLAELAATGEIPEFEVPLVGRIGPPSGELKREAGAGLGTLAMGLGPVAGGAGMFGGEALAAGESTMEAAQKAAIGAGIGGAMRLAGAAISKIPKTAWSSILKRVPTAAVKNPELEAQIAEQGIIGATRESLSKKFGSKIQEVEIEIANALEGKEGRVNVADVVSRLNELKTTYKNIPGEEEALAAIEKVEAQIEKGGRRKWMGVKKANDIKRDIYSVISKTYGKGLLEIPAKREAQKVVARGLKEEIEKVIPEIKNLNFRQGVFIQAKDAIDKTIARETGKGVAGTGVGLYDILIASTGATVGHFGGGQAAPAALGALALKKGIESPAFLSTVAAGSQKLVNLFNQASPTQRLLLYNVIRAGAGEITGIETQEPLGETAAEAQTIRAEGPRFEDIFPVGGGR